MYKVLITTTIHYVGSGSHACSVHTVVVEFETRQGADTAYNQINKDFLGHGITQIARKLYS